MKTLEKLHAILLRLDYPASKDDIIAMVRAMGESDAVIARLQTLPEHRYGSVDTVMDALRGLE